LRAGADERRALSLAVLLVAARERDWREQELLERSSEEAALLLAVCCEA
jgi:hypothetical protein